ncbi:MAG: glycosyltransferase [Planctomycetes bacterium]|nr:glycosyltransferase [Planctomycetota bacterium]
MVPTISLILPSRARPQALAKLFASLAANTRRPDTFEVIVVADADDPATRAVANDKLHVKHAIVRPGLTMGALNMAGYEAATGRILMLLNDDVVCQTPGWDELVRTCFAAYEDEILLVHVNDTVMQKALCTFPIVSRRFCEIAGGICPREYHRYRIDDHIEDHFNMLWLLGQRRTIYLPEVVFEHDNHVTNENGVRQYFSEPATLAVDAPIFDRFAARRKELTLELMEAIAGSAGERTKTRWRRRLAEIADPFALRRAERLRVIKNAALAEPARIRWHDTWWSDVCERLQRCVRETGYRGLAKSLGKKICSAVSGRRFGIFGFSRRHGPAA